MIHWTVKPPKTVIDMNRDNWKTDKPIFVPKTGAMAKNALFIRPAAKHPDDHK